jgi:hypothetical protein
MRYDQDTGALTMLTSRAIGPRLLVLVVLLAPIGCSGPEVPEVTAPPVDPRFATAQAMVEYHNTLTTVSPVRVQEVLNNVYAENVIQERTVRLFQGFAPVLRLNEVVEGRFGQPLDPAASSMQSANQPATITTNDGERAEALFIDEKGKENTLYLVKIGNRWWISGYTFEYAPNAITDIQQLAAIEEMTTVAANVSSELISRVQAGEFADLEECRAAYGIAIVGYMMQHPDRFPNLKEAIASGNMPFGE